MGGICIFHNDKTVRTAYPHGTDKGDIGMLASNRDTCTSARRIMRLTAVSVSTLALAACQTTMGDGGGVASGSAGAAGEQGGDKKAKLETCDQPIGTAALVQSDRSQHATADLPSPVPVLKLLMQQSGCFTVVSRGATGEALQRERELADQGATQSGSDLGEGQLKAADFIIKPSVLFKDANAGGGGAALGSLVSAWTGFAIGGGLKNKQAQTLLSATNVRTGVQEAVAEGSAEKYDLALGFGGFTGNVAGAAGAYQSTDIGKIVMAALMDAHNKLTGQIDAAKQVDKREKVTTWRTAANLNLRAGPTTDAPVITTLAEGTKVRPIGDEQGKWWEIKVDGKQGWVSKNYLFEVTNNSN
jgi:hypothetical protein